MARARKLPDLSTFDGLLDATRRALGAGALDDVLSALPDERHATDLLNEKLATLQVWLARSATHGGWRMQTSDPAASRQPSERDDALLGLARLVEADGWHRIKACDLPNCEKQYIDATNGMVRKFCDVHAVKPRTPAAVRSRQ